MNAVVVYCAASMWRPASCHAHSSDFGTGSMSNSACSSGANAAQSSGAERPVPRWSTSTMSRVRRTRGQLQRERRRASTPPGRARRRAARADRAWATACWPAARRRRSTVLRPSGSVAVLGHFERPHCAACATFGSRHSASAMRALGAVAPRRRTQQRVASASAHAWQGVSRRMHERRDGSVERWAWARYCVRICDMRTSSSRASSPICAIG